MFQTLIAQIKEYKKPSILASLFMTLEVMFEISIPFVMANLLDKGVQQSNMSNIWFYGPHVSLRLSIPILRYAVGSLCGLCLCWICQESTSGHFQEGSKLLL